MCLLRTAGERGALGLKHGRMRTTQIEQSPQLACGMDASPFEVR